MKRALVVVGLLVGCGDGLRGLAEEEGVLVTIRGRIEGQRPSGDVNLRAQVLWADVPYPNPFCLRHGANPLEPDRPVTSSVATYGCADPFNFVPGIAGPSVPIDVDGDSFEVPLRHLPPSDALVGPTTGRVGYASIVVFDDVDDDGELQDFRQRCGERAEQPRDAVHAASFTTLRGEQDRLTYREGEFDEESYFYPAPGCEAPPVGFSVWRVGPALDMGSCRSEPLGAGIWVTYADPESLVSSQCRRHRRSGWPRRPPREEPDFLGLDGPLFTECVDEFTLAITELDCVCPEVDVYTLSGCFNDILCTDPDWDVRQNPPSWWPCRATP